MASHVRPGRFSAGPLRRRTPTARGLASALVLGLLSALVTLALFTGVQRFRAAPAPRPGMSSTDPRAAIATAAPRTTGAAETAEAAAPRTAETAEAAETDSGKLPHDGAARDPRWAAVLGELLAPRAAAWRLGEPRLLRSVYVAGSDALARDQRMLGAYLDRGLRVDGVRMRLSVVMVQRQAPDRASLFVVDRLARAVAYDVRGDALPLPHDLPTRHRIELVMTDAGWRIAAIRPG